MEAALAPLAWARLGDVTSEQLFDLVSSFPAVRGQQEPLLTLGL